jgi:hypothetical protein
MTTDDLRRLWQERSAASEGSRAGCLDESSFAALLSGEMDAKARAEAGNHIALCQDCADEFRALRPLGGPFEQTEPKRPSRLHLGLPLAASLLVATGLAIALVRYRGELERRSIELERLSERERSLVAAGEAREAELASLRERLDSAVSARLGAPIVDLDPYPATRGGAGASPATVNIGEGADLVTLILNFPPRRTREGLQVEIFDEAGELRFEGLAPPQQEAASVNLTLSRAAAPDGIYRIRVSDAGEEIAVYRVRLDYIAEER